MKKILNKYVYETTINNTVLLSIPLCFILLFIYLLFDLLNRLQEQYFIFNLLLMIIGLLLIVFYLSRIDQCREIWNCSLWYLEPSNTTSSTIQTA